jgi:enamine deaminase RidA (YjgF/YER057c/UK114 family)
MRGWFLALLAVYPMDRENIMVRTPLSYQTEAAGFAQAVKYGDFLYISGQVGWTTERRLPPPGDFASQAHQALENIRNILSAQQLTENAVLRLRWYVVGIDREKMQIINKLQSGFFQGRYRAASTVLGVAALARPELLVEIEADAGAKATP